MKIGKTLFIISVLVCFYSMALALPPGHVESGMKASKPGKITSLDTRTMININNLEMFVTNIGGFAEDISVMLETAKADGLYFPAGTSRSVLYSGGLWIGGTVNDEIRVAIGAFDSPEYFPGPADADGGALPDSASYKVYKIWGDSTVWHNPVKTGINMADGTPYTRFDSLTHYNDYLNWPEADGAPVDGAGAPMLVGDQMLWSVFNDGGTHTYDGYGGATDSLGVEVQATFFGFDLPGALGNTIFMKYVLINKSSDVIDSCYVSLWADPDLGGASDDLVGCDTVLSLGYCYNATNNDNTYGSSPPAVGYDFMQGPIIRESDNDPLYAGHDFSADTAFLNTGEVIPQAFIMGMTSFNKYINGTDPDEPEESYGYMKGNDSKGAEGGDPNTPPTNPQTEELTKFYHAGDPVKGTGWIDTNPADRRFMCNTGPFTFKPNDTQVVVAAIVVGQAKDRLSSVTGLKFYDQLAQFAFDVGFEVPAPPPRPIVTARAYDEKVVLTWGNRSETGYNEPNHDFEGYIVYQGETVVGDENQNWTPIAYYDIKNGIGQLSDFVLEPNLGAVVFIPTVYGTDTDLGYGIEIEDDFILGGGLSNGKTYYYGVTAYSYDFDDYNDYVLDPARHDSLYAVPKGLWYLENRVQAISVTPMNPLAGDSWDYASDETDATATLTLVDDTQTPATDVITPYVIDPDSITGHDYEVRFVPVSPDTIYAIDTTVTPHDTTVSSIIPHPDSITPDGRYQHVQDGYDTVYVSHYWEMWDVSTTPETRLQSRQFNKSANGNYRVINGLQVEVAGSYEVEFQSVDYVDNNPAHVGRSISWVDWGGSYFGGAVDYGFNFWGGYLDPATMLDSFMTVELRFTDDIPLADPGNVHGQRAYNYLRPGYGYQGYFQVPFTVWDAPNNRQLNACFVEWEDSDVYDSTWNPDGSSVGGREYLLINRSSYDGDDLADAGTGTIDYTTEDMGDGSTFDWLYAGWFRQRGTRTMDSGDVLRFTFAVPADANDVYSFSTTMPQRENAADGKAAIEDIRVVPNPYYAYSQYEVDQFDRQVRFLGLPNEFKIRIFNVAGDMVRSLDWDDALAHTPGNSWAKWNLMTDQGLPVASGIYIWYIETEFGTKYGKMAIIQEVEQLTTY